MTNTQEILNKLLVQLFNDILHIEEKLRGREQKKIEGWYL